MGCKRSLGSEVKRGRIEDEEPNRQEENERQNLESGKLVGPDSQAAEPKDQRHTSYPHHYSHGPSSKIKPVVESDVVRQLKTYSQLDIRLIRHGDASGSSLSLIISSFSNCTWPRISLEFI